MLAKFQPEAHGHRSLTSGRGPQRGRPNSNSVRAERAEAKAAAKRAPPRLRKPPVRPKPTRAAEALDAKRGERKERKALTKAEAKAKRDARYAARKARR